MGGVSRLNGIRGLTYCAVVGVAVLSLLMLSASAHAAAQYEPNDSRETAHGPLAGDTWYSAKIDTVNDVDWYLFYVKTYSQIEFSATATAKESPSTSFYLYDRDGEEVDSDCCGSDFYAYPEFTDRLPLTMSPGRYYIKAQGYDVGASYKFRIDPAASLTTSRECGEAIVAKDLVGPQLADVDQELAKNAETLATRAAAVHAAKADLRPASSRVKRLRGKVKRLRKLRRAGVRPRRTRAKLARTSARLRLARSEVRGAVEDVNEAKEARRPVWQERVNLEAVAGQRRQEIANADAQIAAHC